MAAKERGTRWQVDDSFKQVLSELGARNDIIKQLYSSLGNEAGRVERVMSGALPSAPVSGLVIAKGSPDEIGDDRFVVLRDGGGKAHYGRVRDGQDFRDLQIGSIAQLGGGGERRRQVTEQIAAVATANNGVYTAQLHEDWLRGRSRVCQSGRLPRSFAPPYGGWSLPATTKDPGCAAQRAVNMRLIQLCFRRPIRDQASERTCRCSLCIRCLIRFKPMR